MSLSDDDSDLIKSEEEDEDDMGDDESMSESSSDDGLAISSSSASKRPRTIASKRPVATKRPNIASKRPRQTASKKMPSKKPRHEVESDSEEDFDDFDEKVSDDDGDHDDEEEEDDDDDDEDEDEENAYSERSSRKGTKRPRKTVRGSEFIDMDVDVDEDELDDDDEQEVDEKELEEREREANERQERRVHRPILNEEEEEEKLQSIARDVERRYGARRVDADDEDGAPKRRSARQQRGVRQQTNILPTINDPKLWLLHCKAGKERVVICDLMQRFYSRVSLPLEVLFIKSAFATAVGSGYFYVEAEKQIHVEKAIANLRFVYGQKIMLVPVKEMVQALTIKTKKINLKRGQWVRVRRGIFKGDLAQVLGTGDQQTDVTVKLVPRLDLSKIAHDGVKNFSSKSRPAQRLVNPAVLREMGESIERRVEPTTGARCMMYAGNYYRLGFLLKNIKIRGLQLEHVEPTLAEIEKFQARVRGSDDEDDGDDEDDATNIVDATKALASLPQSDSSTLLRLTKGNAVKVIEGDLKHLTGVVLNVVGDSVSIMPSHEDLHEPITFPLSDLRKFFKLGDHVKVVRGDFKDDTGLIVRVEDNDDVVVVFSDISSREMRVLASDLIESSEVSSGRDTLGNFELHDLVSIRDSVGIIVKVEIGSFQVLDTKGVIVPVRLQDIGRRRNNRFAVALDANHNQIIAGDIAKIQKGTHSGIGGTILHIFRSFLFLRSREIADNGGVLVVRGKSCTLVGADRRSDEHSRTMNMDRGKSGNTRALLPAVPAFAVRRRRPQSHPLLHATVVIKSGPYKGLLGIVKDADDREVRVELHAKSKTVTVSTPTVMQRGGAGGDAANGFGVGSYGSQTPLISSQTPVWGDSSRTPLHQPHTPMHMSTTPIHDVYASSPTHTHTPSASTPHDDEHHHVDTPSWPTASTPQATTPMMSVYDHHHHHHHHPPGTPVSGDMQTPNTHTPHTPTTPYGMAFTPASSDTPYTPNIQTPSTPSSTPITPFDSQLLASQAAAATQPIASCGPDWIVAGMEVKLRNGGAIGRVVDAGVGGVETQVIVDGHLQTIAGIELTPIAPAKNDELIIMSGENKGQTGSLLGFDGTDGIVKMQSLDINMIEMSSLAKLAVIH